MTQKKGLYPGWIIMIVGMYLMAVVFAPVLTLGGVFTNFVTAEFEVTRTAFTTHISIAAFTSMFAALVAGKILQTKNTKLVIAAALAVGVVCFLGYSFTTAVWQFYVLSAVMGVAFMFSSSIAVSILMNNWFGPKLRGKAMGIALTGSGISAVILNPVLTKICENYGWRMSYRLVALLIAIAIPLVLITVSRTPADRGWEKLGEIGSGEAVQQVAVRGLSTKQAFASAMFWLLLVCFFLYSATTTIFNINGVPYFTDIGFEAVKAASLMSISSAAVIVGKILLGTISDKWGALRGAASAIFCLVLGTAGLVVAAKTNSVAFVAVALFGLGNALGTVAIPLIIAELFGNRDYGSLVGICNTGTGMVGPLFGAAIYDVTGSYITAWCITIALMVLMLLGTVLAYRLKKGAYQKAGEPLER